MIGTGIKLDDFIAELLKIRKQHGNIEVWVNGGDYPEGAGKPVYLAKAGDGYHKDNTVVIP